MANDKREKSDTLIAESNGSQEQEMSEKSIKITIDAVENIVGFTKQKFTCYIPKHFFFFFKLIGIL